MVVVVDSFQGSDCREGPAGAAASLVLHCCHCALAVPLKGLGEVGGGGLSTRAFLGDGGLLQLIEVLSSEFLGGKVGELIDSNLKGLLSGLESLVVAVDKLNILEPNSEPVDLLS